MGSNLAAFTEYSSVLAKKFVFVENFGKTESNIIRAEAEKVLW
jgi:hypothetical protein